MDRVSPHFRTVALTDCFNANRRDLPSGLRTPGRFAQHFGNQTIRGIPFLFGTAHSANAIYLDRESISIDLGSELATYLLFVHAVEDAQPESPRPNTSFDEIESDGYHLGEAVSEYKLAFADGTTHSTSIVRRFAIQQARFRWGSAPFACVAAANDRVRLTPDEVLGLARPPKALATPTRVASGLDSGLGGADPGLLWIYALVNPCPTVPLRAVICAPRTERSAIYALTLTEIAAHPLRASMRRKIRLRLPDGVDVNAIGEVDSDKIDIDLGVVISARQALNYDDERWLGQEAQVEPTLAQREVIVEYAAHPQARLYLGNQTHELASIGDDPLIEIRPSESPVTLRFVERGSDMPVAVRLHLHGSAGEYLPPRGHHRRVSRYEPNQDLAAEFVNVENQYAYVDGECIVDLPRGDVYIEVTRGYEIAPIREKFEVTGDTREFVFELERVLPWRERGWVTADTHVHFLSPTTALLEAKAEGVNVVNLLAAQWGEMFSNVGDFDGVTTLGAGSDGCGEFLVRVGSENRMQVLGHISLLGYKGRLIQPLSTGGPDESAFGDPLELTMAEWAQHCLDQGGLVVMPHAPTPQLERAADIVLGLVNAIELMTFNPLNPQFGALNAYGLADWYRYLNLGYHVPLVGGSDKMSAGMLLGGIRTYAQLDGAELNYDNWMKAVRVGNTFVTVGPLASLEVEGVQPGQSVRLPAGGGTVEITWKVESLRVPLEAVEIVVGGLIADSKSLDGEISAEGVASIRITGSSWIALRVRGSYHNRPDDIVCHTSAIQLLVDDSELFSESDSMAVLDQIQGALAYVDTLAPRAELHRFRELRATLESAYNRLHLRMHAAGIYHRHPLHNPTEPHEH